MEARLEALKTVVDVVGVAGDKRYGDIKRLWVAVLEGDVEHVEDLVPVDAPEGFKRLVVSLASIVRDYREGRLSRGEALAAVARLLGFDATSLLLSMLG